MKLIKFIFSKTVVKNKLHTHLNGVQILPLSKNMPNSLIDLKDFGKWNKNKQDEIYFRQRSLKFKSTQKFKQKIKKKKKIKKSLAYKLFFNQEEKKYEKSITYTNLAFLKVYLTRYGKIRSRQLTKLKIFEQSKIAKLIRKARSLKLVPLKFNVLS
jgi:ribosomal protein S18